MTGAAARIPLGGLEPSCLKKKVRDVPVGRSRGPTVVRGRKDVTKQTGAGAERRSMPIKNESVIIISDDDSDDERETSLRCRVQERQGDVLAMSEQALRRKTSEDKGLLGFTEGVEDAGHILTAQDCNKNLNGTARFSQKAKKRKHASISGPADEKAAELLAGCDEESAVLRTALARKDDDEATTSAAVLSGEQSMAASAANAITKFRRDPVFAFTCGASASDDRKSVLDRNGMGQQHAPMTGQGNVLDKKFKIVTSAPAVGSNGPMTVNGVHVKLSGSACAALPRTGTDSGTAMAKSLERQPQALSSPGLQPGGPPSTHAGSAINAEAPKTCLSLCTDGQGAKEEIHYPGCEGVPGPHSDAAISSCAGPVAPKGSSAPPHAPAPVRPPLSNTVSNFFLALFGYQRDS